MNLTSLLPIAILGSGKGSNFDAIAGAIEAQSLDALIACVISDVREAPVLMKAEGMGIPSHFLDPGPSKYSIAPEYEGAYIQTIEESGAELVVLAGFMRIIPKKMVRHFKGRIINIHPSLLPSFKGLKAWEQALDYGVKITGCSVHFVDEGIDTGPLILQAAVQVYDNDTPESLHSRIQEEEHKIYPRAIQLIANTIARCNGRRVSIET